MYTLMDIEWIEIDDQTRYPSQIAAMRVDECWRFQNMFYTRIRPLDERFWVWDHVGYAGSTEEEFLSAPTLEEAAEIFHSWLREDDILCWWINSNRKAFAELIGPVGNKRIVLFSYVQNYLVDRPQFMGNPYHIAEKLKIDYRGNPHDSRCDVEMIRTVLWDLRFPQDLLQRPASDMLDQEKILPRYILDIPTNRIHKSDCEELPHSDAQKVYPGLKTVVINDCKPCSCCVKDFYAARRERNRWIIDKSEYNFIFSPNSNVFHTRDCKIVLSSAADVRGTIKYKTCIEKKRKPCKVCNPVPLEVEVLPQKKGEKKLPNSFQITPIQRTESICKKRKNQPKKRNLTDQEQRALKRLKQAQAERKSTPKIPSMSNQQITDRQTLTHSGYAFWVATGYKRFHLRHCGRLNGVSNIKGFSRYEEAVQMGYRPCRQCKPTPKHNLELSFPFFSKERPGEHVGSIKTLCNIVGYQCTELGGGLQIETPKGIWRVYTDSTPYRVEHINKRSTPGNTTEFHVQPRIFLSLTDVYMYIKRHDTEE